MMTFLFSEIVHILCWQTLCEIVSLQTFIWTFWTLGQNLTNFWPPNLKFHNPSDASTQLLCMLDFSAMKLGQSSFCHRGKPILELDSHKTFSSVVIACNHQKLKWLEDIFIYLVKRLKSYFIILIKIHRTKEKEKLLRSYNRCSYISMESYLKGIRSLFQVYRKVIWKSTESHHQSFRVKPIWQKLIFQIQCVCAMKILCKWHLK